MTKYVKKNSFENWADFEVLLSNLTEDSDWEALEFYDSGEIDLGFTKRFFKNKNNGEVWELVEPDPPFRGSWNKVG